MTILLLTVGAAQSNAAPADYVRTDTMTLGEVTTVAMGPRRVLRTDVSGATIINAEALSEHPSLLGGNDPIALLRSLPAVQTPNELQAGITVRGMGPGHNLFTTDGARVVNPMHMLGLYSAFNPAYYRDFTFSPGHERAVDPSAPGGVLAARSGEKPDSTAGFSASIGLLESHGAMRLPLGNKASIAVGARQTYLNAIYPNLLRVGHSRLLYDFTDLNASLFVAPSSCDVVRLSVFANRDDMRMRNRDNGDKDGNFGWCNAAASASWIHGVTDVTIAYTTYCNSFEMEEGDRKLDLSSRLTEGALRAQSRIGKWTIAGDAILRLAKGQRNVNERACEFDAAADYRHAFTALFTVEAGLRLAFYHCGGYNAIYPQPRLRIEYGFNDTQKLFATAGRYVKFDRLVQETTGGLPADYWAVATKTHKPEDAVSLSVGTSGRIAPLGMFYSIEGYYKHIGNAVEFAGSILDLTNTTYNPDDNLIVGQGYSYGVSLSAMRQFGKVRGRVGYNIGRSRLRFDRYGARYLPSSHDRLHDLSLTMSYQPVKSLTLSATFTHATGLPYTSAKYGYMIGENLICEYFPHNSSRLPAYNRLDLSVTYKIPGNGRLHHVLNASVYNAAANQNVLFVYTSYSVADGISQHRSVMKNVIPSITYTISL